MLLFLMPGADPTVGRNLEPLPFSWYPLCFCNGAYIENGGINTLNVGDGAIDQLAAIDQAESHFRSENIKFGIRHRMRSGKTVLNHTQFLGYTKGPDGILQVMPEEAEVVRKVFDLYVQGNGVRKNKRYLEEHGIKTATGKSERSPCLHPLNFGDVLYFSLICDMIFNKSRNKVERSIKR